jgi:hypothetical protein
VARLWCVGRVSGAKEPNHPSRAKCVPFHSDTPLRDGVCNCEAISCGPSQQLFPSRASVPIRRIAGVRDDGCVPQLGDCLPWRWLGPPRRRGGRHAAGRGLRWRRTGRPVPPRPAVGRARRGRLAQRRRRHRMRRGADRAGRRTHRRGRPVASRAPAPLATPVRRTAGRHTRGRPDNALPAGNQR